MAELKLLLEKKVTWTAAKKAVQNRIRWKAMVPNLYSAMMSVKRKSVIVWRVHSFFIKF